LLQAQAPALQLPQLRVLDCRCCGTFPSNTSSLPQLQTLGSSAPVDAAWHVVVDHMPEAAAAAAASGAQATGAESVLADDAAVADDAAAASATAVVAAAATVTSALASDAAASGEQAPASNYSEAVLQLLSNDIATPTRGQAWKVHCKK
jgi:hypothetical protein